MRVDHFVRATCSGARTMDVQPVSKAQQTSLFGDFGAPAFTIIGLTVLVQELHYCMIYGRGFGKIKCNIFAAWQRR